jgi:hypothetical protein
MTTSSANSLSSKSRKEERILRPFSSAFFLWRVASDPATEVVCSPGESLPMIEVEL